MILTEITIHTRQFEEMKAFYETGLGLGIHTEQASHLSFKAGESILTLMKESSNERNTLYHIAFTIPTNKLDEAKQWLSRRGITLFTDKDQVEFHFDNWDADAVYFYDPDGNLIEFIAHHTLDNAVNEAFGSKQLLRISEIGLPVEEVPDTVKKLNEGFQLSLWSGDGEQFAAMGDALGLLIVVNQNRPWFPDGRAPVIGGTRVSIQGTKVSRLSLEEGQYEINSVSAL